MPKCLSNLLWQVSAGLVNFVIERLGNIDQEIAHDGINYYEVLALLRILLNTAFSSKPANLKDLQNHVYQEFIKTKSHEYFYRELSCVSPAVANMAKRAVKDVFGGSVEDESFEKGVHPLQLRPCANPSCQKSETRRGEFRKCGACRRMVYCSPSCQRAHWLRHKAGCQVVKGMFKQHKPTMTQR